MRLVFTLPLMLAGALAMGCSLPHLAGTNDAALEYAAGSTAEGEAPPSAALVAAGMKARLASAQIPADVEADDRVRVVVDADIAGAVDELLTWRGGVAV